MHTDQEIIDKCVALFSKLEKVHLVAILKTDRAGDTVNNGMGVEFDVKPYYLLYQIESRKVHQTESSFSEVSRILYDNGMDEYISSDSIHSDKLEEDIERYRSVDNYNPIWISADYKEIDKPTLSLQRHVGDISVCTSRSYILSISYEELKRYTKEKKSYYYQYDLFRVLVEQVQKKHKITDNEHFITDRAKLKQTIYTEKGIEFYFEVKDRIGILSDFSRLSFPISDSNPEIVGALEDTKLISDIKKACKEKWKKFFSNKEKGNGSHKDKINRKG